MHKSLATRTLGNFLVECEQNIQFTNTSNYGPNGIYHADQAITCSGEVRIEPERSVVFNAGQAVVMDDGFEVKVNARFLAEVQTCSPDNFVGHN